MTPNDNDLVIIEFADWTEVWGFLLELVEGDRVRLRLEDGREVEYSTAIVRSIRKIVKDVGGNDANI